ncbi:MAG: phosphoglycerate dehydrogenase [Planctomycetota bacterium]|nr:MAG: phosphoglycerate dehydrogenase [Planctomycetota bacterium]
MRYKVLVTAPYMQLVIDRFRHIFEAEDIELIVPPFQERFEEEELLGMVEDVNGVICGDDRFTERVLRAAPQLKVLSKWGTGIDSIDQAACKRLGVAVCNTPNAFSKPVADTVLGYILNFARQLPWVDRTMRQGTWSKVHSVALHECTLGVIGVGNVGKEVVRRATAFGMRVVGNDIVEMPVGFLTETGIEMVWREELLHEADFVSLNCTLNPTSFHLMSDAEFALMKPTAVVINTSRGPVIDEPALVRALQEKQIAGAALDVFEVEPLPADSPLLAMDNVMLAPHNANSGAEAWERVHQNTIRNLLEVLKGEVKWKREQTTCRLC